MTNPIIRIHNTETNEIVDREMTSDEFAIHQSEQAAYVQREQEKAAQEAARIAAKDKLTALGLTLDDLKALGL